MEKKTDTGAGEEDMVLTAVGLVQKRKESGHLRDSSQTENTIGGIDNPGKQGNVETIHYRMAIASTSSGLKRQYTFSTFSTGEPVPSTSKNCTTNYGKKSRQTLEHVEDLPIEAISISQDNMETEIQKEEDEEILNYIGNIEMSNKLSKSSPDFKMRNPSNRWKESAKRSNACRRETRSQARRNKHREKLHCICRTPYDKKQFYIECASCFNLFHGDCVNITKRTPKKLIGYLCDNCKENRSQSPELYCSCRQPDNEGDFYILCDICQYWFHGRCVGIQENEAVFIDEYACPYCRQNLTENEIYDLKKLIEEMQLHRSAWPFMEPMDPDEAPDYYAVIKEPMDLKMIEENLDSNVYTNVFQFNADVKKIFDNCRRYHPKETSIYNCASSLEAFFLKKIKDFRESLFFG